MSAFLRVESHEGSDRKTHKTMEDIMKKLMTLAAAAIIFTGFETAALNAAETETAAETEIQQQDLKELKEGLKDGSKNGLAQGYKKGLAQGYRKGLAQGYKKGLAQGMKNGLKNGLKSGRKEGLKNGRRK